MIFASGKSTRSFGSSAVTWCNGRRMKNAQVKPHMLRSLLTARKSQSTSSSVSQPQLIPEFLSPNQYNNCTARNSKLGIFYMLKRWPNTEVGWMSEVEPQHPARTEQQKHSQKSWSNSSKGQHKTSGRKTTFKFNVLGHLAILQFAALDAWLALWQVAAHFLTMYYKVSLI